MAKLIDLIQAADAAPLWLDDSAYVDRLLASGKTPWLQSAEYVALRRKAMGLLKPDFNVVPVGEIARAWVEANPTLREAMAAKKRVIVPARTLLADEGLRSQLLDTLQGLRAAFSSTPMVLQMPSPRALVGFAYRMAFGDDAEVDVGEDEADSCSVYVAEFLRTFGEAGVDALLLVEDASSEPASADELGWYQPVINVTGHYRWDLGVQLPTGSGLEAAPEGFHFVISPSEVAGLVHGHWIDDGFWTNGDAPSPSGGFTYARIPADAVPESVLERLASLR